jgi:hypothetical protein
MKNCFTIQTKSLNIKPAGKGSKINFAAALKQKNLVKKL